MLDYSKPGPAPHPPEDMMDPVPLPPQSSSGKLFVPSKRPVRNTAYNPNAQVGQYHHSPNATKVKIKPS